MHKSDGSRGTQWSELEFKTVKSLEKEKQVSRVHMWGRLVFTIYLNKASEHIQIVLRKKISITHSPADYLRQLENENKGSLR